MHTAPLADFTSAIRAGHQFRSRIDPEPDGAFHVIQGKDIDERQRIDWEGLVWVDSRHINDPERNCLVPGDVLFMARGTRLRATLITEEVQPRTVAVASFHVLTPDPEKILPGFLAWAINDEHAQSWLKSNTSGTTIPMITQKTLRDLPLQVPSLETQDRFLRMHDLAERERDLADRLYAARQEVLRGLLRT